MTKRYFCPIPVLSLTVQKRKREPEFRYRKRFERAMSRFNRMLALRVKLSDLSKVAVDGE